jgi:hypothetical protein
MGDRLPGFPIESCKYRHCYHISTHSESFLQVFESIKKARCSISVWLSDFVL